ncbi:hypothetical protein AQUCO_01700288v1 [Aquilegia coerulea]|uniref:Uncharacterized protein n=1 Tax=Aquilegia coerulea TaxID=218851 RepID=A0A2G5DM82_AQUCA|nr:hypothetical protein AQUCO_01700288v1 [Aquilegia coerulea]
MWQDFYDSSEFSQIEKESLRMWRKGLYFTPKSIFLSQQIFYKPDSMAFLLRQENRVITFISWFYY